MEKWRTVYIGTVKSFPSFVCVMVFSLVAATSLTWSFNAKSQNTKVMLEGEKFVKMLVAMSLVLAGLGACRVVR